MRDSQIFLPLKLSTFIPTPSQFDLIYITHTSAVSLLISSICHINLWSLSSVIIANMTSSVTRRKWKCLRILKGGSLIMSFDCYAISMLPDSERSQCPVHFSSLPIWDCFSRADSKDLYSVIWLNKIPSALTRVHYRPSCQFPCEPFEVGRLVRTSKSSGSSSSNSVNLQDLSCVSNYVMCTVCKITHCA